MNHLGSYHFAAYHLASWHLAGRQRAQPGACPGVMLDDEEELRQRRPRAFEDEEELLELVALLDP